MHSTPDRGRKLTLMQVSSRDGLAFTARLLLVMIWLMLLAIAYAVYSGGQRPKESPQEIILGMVLITAALTMVLVIRRNEINRRLSRSIPVPARIYHSAHVQFFITVGLLYEWHGREMKRTVQVPAGKSTKFLKEREEVILLVDPEDPKKVMIGDLYNT